MPQTSEVYFPYTVYETVMLGTYASSGSAFGGVPATAVEYALKCMEDCGVSDLKDRHLDELSGGQLQRVLLARTFAQKSPFLFLDEPGNNLDIKYRAELCDKLNVWAAGETSGIPNTLVAIFHDLEQARRCCTRAVMLKDGKVVFDGDISEAMKPDMLMKVYDFDVTSYIGE
jgi:iron complex transport system ATP-binding protein